MAMLRVAAVSTGPAAGDFAAALAGAEDAVAAAAANGAGLIVLPETFAVPYVASDEPARWRHLAGPLDGAIGHWAAMTARRCGRALMFGMAVAEDGGKAVNAAVVATPEGSLRTCAEKVNLPPRGDDAFGESAHYRPGRGIVEVVTLGGVRVAGLVCYDRRYPESWRAAIDRGADLVCVLVAGPAPGDPPGLYEAELRTHARANAVFVAAAARSGIETILGREVRHDGVTLTLDSDGSLVDVAPAAAGATAWLTISDHALAQARERRAVRTAGRDAYDMNSKRITK